MTEYLTCLQFQTIHGRTNLAFLGRRGRLRATSVELGASRSGLDSTTDLPDAIAIFAFGPQAEVTYGRRKMLPTEAARREPRSHDQTLLRFLHVAPNAGTCIDFLRGKVRYLG